MVIKVFIAELILGNLNKLTIANTILPNTSEALKNYKVHPQNFQTEERIIRSISLKSLAMQLSMLSLSFKYS